MLPGIRVRELNKIPDERGFFCETFREDWRDFFEDDRIVQSNLSLSFPGVIRAWHRHSRGQVDYFVVLRGALKICAYDDRPDSSTRGELSKIDSGGERLQMIRMPGYYWHGFKVLGNEPALLMYFVNRLYDYQKPDEERRPWDDLKILDPETKQPFDWNGTPFQ